MLRKTLLALLAVPMSLLAQTTEPANLVVNGDFSKVADGKPDSWATSGSKIDVTQTPQRREGRRGQAAGQAGLHSL